MLIISQLLTLILIKDSVRSTTLLEVSPRNPVLKVGQNFTFKCSVATQLLYCRIQLPGKTSGYNLHENVPRKADYWYEGAGLKSGQCGITIARITDEQNGQFQCTMSTLTDYEEIVGSTNVTVARAPQDPPELMVSPEPGQNGVYREDTTIIARCSVKKARPKATLTWYIDDSKITDGVSRDEIIESPENLYTVNENLMLRPTWKDGTSKILRCEVNHITYDTPFSINKQISVGICPPISEECLTCMCEASTDCNFNELCRDGYCGPFSISHGFWLDGGMHTSNHSTLKGEEVWQTCARDPFCAAMSVRDYMKRYCKDCNADGKVDCTDFALIHQVQYEVKGPKNCGGEVEIQNMSMDIFENCECMQTQDSNLKIPDADYTYADIQASLSVVKQGTSSSSTLCVYKERGDFNLKMPDGDNRPTYLEIETSSSMLQRGTSSASYFYKERDKSSQDFSYFEYRRPT